MQCLQVFNLNFTVVDKTDRYLDWLECSARRVSGIKISILYKNDRSEDLNEWNSLS